MSGVRRGLALAALALMLFTYLTSEVFAAGAMVPLRDELGVSEAAVGALVSSYAVIAAVAIPPMSALTRRIPPRVLLPAAMAALAVSHVVVALSPSLTWMLVARGGAALFHGVVWASAPAVAAALIPGRPGRATGYVFVGSSLGNVLGAPFVAAMSDAVSWRVAAAVLAGLSVVCAVGLGSLLPREANDTGDNGAEKRGRPDRTSVLAVVRWSATVVLAAAAHLAAYTYIAPLAASAGVPPSLLSVLLLAMGAAGLVGTLVVGPLHDRWPTGSVLVTLGTLVVAFAVTTLPLPWFVAGAVAWAAVYSAVTVALQAAVLRDAPGWGRQASAWYVLAFQIGIAAGAHLGGVIVSGPGAAWLGWASAAATAAAFLLVATTVRRVTSDASTEREVAGHHPP